MKATKSADLRNLSESELQQQIADSEQSLVDMRFRQTMGQLESTAAIRTVRRDIARMKTLLRERSANITRG